MAKRDYYETLGVSRTAKDAEITAKAEELAAAREEAASKLKALDGEAASKLAASEKALASTRSELDSRSKEIANLKRQVAEVRDAAPAPSKDENGNPSNVQSDLDGNRILELSDGCLEVPPMPPPAPDARTRSAILPSLCSRSASVI